MAFELTLSRVLTLLISFTDFVIAYQRIIGVAASAVVLLVDLLLIVSLQVTPRE